VSSPAHPSPESRQAVPADIDVRSFGASGDGRTLDTAAINRAIGAIAASGGGRLVFPPGNYLSHSIRLCSNLELHLCAGATLIAAEPPPEGETGGYDAPEEGAPNLHQDFGHSRFRNSLLWGEELENLSLTGQGVIHGRGLSRGNGRVALPVNVVAPQPAGHLPDVLEADGELPPIDMGGLRPGAFGYPHGNDTLPAGVGNKAIALRGCRRILISGLTILHAGHFAILATACDNLTIDNLLIDTNRDGIDIDACANVRISRCSVNSPWDDGICIKASYGAGVLRPVENVTVSDCYVSGFEEGTLHDGTRGRRIRHRGGPIGRIKLGTEGSGGFRNIAISNCIFEFCRGLAIEQVDGSPMEDVVVSNITMREVMNAPIFIRLGARLRRPGEQGPATLRRVSIANLSASEVAPEHGIFIAGLPGHKVEDVRLSGIKVSYRGGGTAEEARREVPELPAGYPEPMLFGTLPSWALFARHVSGLHISGLESSLCGQDERPAFHLEDVSGASLSGLRFPVNPARSDWTLINVSGLQIQNGSGA